MGEEKPANGGSELPLRFSDELSTIREHGFAVENGEMIEGVQCWAAPIIDRTGEPIAAFSVLAHAGGRRPAAPQELVQAVTAAAAEVSRKLGYHRAMPVARSFETPLQAEVG